MIINKKEVKNELIKEFLKLFFHGNDTFNIK